MIDDGDTLIKLSKGANMGMYAITCIRDKISNRNLNKVLDIEYSKYNMFNKLIKVCYRNHEKKDLINKVNKMLKVMISFRIDMKTFNNISISRLAEILINGTNMGIIEGRKILNKKDLSIDVFKITKKFIEMQEDSVLTLQKYL